MNYYDDTPYFLFRQQPGPLGTDSGMMPGFPQSQMVPQMPMMQSMPMMQPMMQPSMGGMPALPSGVPAGPLVGPIPGVPSPGGQAPSVAGPSPTTLDSTKFVPGYLRTQIGKQVRVEFLIGSTGPLVDRIGTLVGVGTSYILIRPVESDDLLLCDLYSIKFVTFFG